MCAVRLIAALAASALVGMAVVACKARDRSYGSSSPPPLDTGGLAKGEQARALDGSAPMPEHAVIVKFRYARPDLEPLRVVEDQLESAITKAGAGQYDGDEIAVNLSDGSLYMYGPNADRLFSAIRPVLESTSFMDGALVTLRYGPPQHGVRETTIAIRRHQ